MIVLGTAALLLSGCALQPPGEAPLVCSAQGEVLSPEGDTLYYGASPCTPAKTPYLFIDEFERDDAQTLGPQWTDCKSVQPNSYEPLGIREGGAAIAAINTREGVYDQSPPSGHPPTDNRLYPGIGCAFVDTGSTAVSVKLIWSGNFGLGAEAASDGIAVLNNDVEDGNVNHVEATPLLYINTDHPRFGFGAWTTQLYGNGVFLLGYIGHPAENYEVIATATLGEHYSGTTREVEIRADTPGKITLWLDGKQLPIHKLGLEPLEIDPDLIDSTLHGIAVDAHFVEPRQKIVELKGIEAVQIKQLGNTGP